MYDCCARGEQCVVVESQQFPTKLQSRKQDWEVYEHPKQAHFFFRFWSWKWEILIFFPQKHNKTGHFIRMLARLYALLSKEKCYVIDEKRKWTTEWRLFRCVNGTLKLLPNQQL